MRISDWSSDVCSSDLFGRAGGSERDAPGSLTNDIQRLGGKARRFDAPGADHLNASVARLPRHTDAPPASAVDYKMRSEEHTSELQSLMRNSYAVFCLKKKEHHV